ncbi:MAG: hypothetical protein WA960_03645 [Tunicatimonas sp.]
MKYFLLTILLGLLLPSVSSAQVQAVDTTARPQVLVMNIRSEIDPRMSRYVMLALERAEDADIDYLLMGAFHAFAFDC